VQNLGNPLQLYLLVGALFIVVNYTLGRLAGVVEQRVARGLLKGRPSGRFARPWAVWGGRRARK
jgi:hypothetical protein